MKRSLIAIAVAVLAAGTDLALADDQFMDSYWKDLSTVRSRHAMPSGESIAEFGFVDLYPAQ
jgi:hypothetical protein